MFGVIGGGGSDDMVLNSLVNNMVAVWCLVSPFFFSFRVVRDSLVRRKGFMGTAFSYMGQ